MVENNQEGDEQRPSLADIVGDNPAVLGETGEKVSPTALRMFGDQYEIDGAVSYDNGGLRLFTLRGRVEDENKENT